MKLIYFDEVKHDPPIQNSYWIGGVSIDVNDIPEIEKSLNEVSTAVFGSSILTKDTEFHGKEITHGKGNFKGKKLKERLNITKQLIDIVQNEKVKKNIR